MEPESPESSLPQPSVEPSQAFARFLEYLSRDPARAATEYERLRQKLASYFQIHGTDAPDAAADMVLDRVATKIADGAQVDKIYVYCLGIARLVVLELFRRSQKERDA